MYRVILQSAAVLAVTTCFSFPAQAVEVYLFKGAGDFSFINKNMHFSRGLERIADQMKAEGIHAEVRRFGAVEDAMATIRRRKPESVAFIGHSMGALASLSMARRMQEEGIRVAYIGLIDIPGPVGVAGKNVEWAENYYSIHPVYGKLTNVQSHPKAQNIHVAGYIHNRLDDAPKVQLGLLSAVRAVHAAEQEILPEIQPDYSQQGTSYASSWPQQQPQPQAEVQPQQPVTLSGPAYVPPTPQSEAPVQLPSVSPQYDVAQDQQYDPQQPIDPIITTGVEEQPGVVQSGRNLLNKASGYIRGLNFSVGSGNRKPQRDSER